jgi:hypothetical protein
MGRGSRHNAFHGSNGAADAIAAADGRRSAETPFVHHSSQPQVSSAAEGSQTASLENDDAVFSLWEALEFCMYDVAYTIEDRFIIPQTIAAIPPLPHEGDGNRVSVAALIGYFMSVSTLLAFAAYSRRLSNLMSGASPVMGEILFCVSHLSQVTQEQLGWSLFCSGFLSPSCFDWSAADGGGGGGSNAAGSQAARRQVLGGGIGSGASSGGSGGGGGSFGSGVAGSGAGYASYSGGNLVRYLLGKKTNNVLRQESLRSYLYSSFYSPSAFLVEQTCWFAVLIATLDTITLQRIAVATFFGNAVGWVPVYSVGALATLASALLFVFMYWIPSYEISDGVLSALFLHSSLHHVVSAYCASLCITLLFAESMLLDDLRRSFVSLVFSLPQRALRLSGGHPVIAQALRACSEVRHTHFYFVDFYFFLGIVFWFSLVLMETAAGISILGIAALLMVVPCLVGSGWTTTPARALKDTLVYFCFYALMLSAMLFVVPLSGFAFLSNAVQAATIVMFMVARCEHKQPNGCAYVLIWVFMLAFYLYEKVGTGSGAAGSAVWAPQEITPTTVRVSLDSAAQIALQDHSSPNAEAVGIARVVCFTFWQLLSKGLSEEGTQVVHINAAVLGSMLLLSTTVHAAVVEGIGLSPMSALSSAATTAAASSSAASTPVPSSGTAAPTGGPPVPATAAGNAAPSTNTTSALAKMKNGSIASGSAKVNASGTKLLSRSSPQESHSASGANLDSTEVARASTVEVDIVPATPEVQEGAATKGPNKTADKPPLPTPARETQPHEPSTVLPVAVDAAAAREEAASVVEAVPAFSSSLKGLLSEVTAVAAADSESPKPVERKAAVETTAQPTASSPVRERSEGTPRVAKAAVTPETPADAMATAVKTKKDATAERTPEAKKATTPVPEVKKSAAPPAVVVVDKVPEKVLPSPVAESPQPVTVAVTLKIKEAREETAVVTPVSAGTSATAAKEKPTESSKGEEVSKATEKAEPAKTSVKGLPNASGSVVVEDAARTSPASQSNDNSLTSPASVSVAKLTTPTASKTSESSVSSEEPKKNRRQRERERKKLQQERRRASLLAEAEAKQTEARRAEVKSPDVIPATAPSAAPVKTPALPLPRSQTEGFKKPSPAAAPVAEAAQAVPPPKPERAHAAVNDRPSKTEAKAPPTPITVTPKVKSPTTTEKAGGNNSNGQNKDATPAATAAIRAAENNKAEKKEPANNKSKSVTSSPVTSAAGNAKVTHNSSTTAAESDNNNKKTSPKSPSAAPPFPLPKPRHEQAAAAAAKTTTNQPSPAATPAAAAAATPPLTAAEKLRRSANPATPSGKAGRTETSVANTPASGSPATTKATAPAPSTSPVYPTTTATVSASPDAAAATSAPLPVPLPRSAQSAETEAKKESQTTRPVHTKAGIKAAANTKRETEKTSKTPAAVVSKADAVTPNPVPETAVPNAAASMPAMQELLTGSAAAEDGDDSYDLDRVLNFLKLKSGYTDDDNEYRSSSDDSGRCGYRRDAFFHAETPTSAQAGEACFSTVTAQTTPGPVIGNAISLFSTVPQLSEHVNSLHDLSAAPVSGPRPSMSGGTQQDFAQRPSQTQPLQQSSEWTARASESVYGDVASDSFNSGTVAPSTGSFHVFSTHPQGAAAMAAAAAAAAAAASGVNTTSLSPPQPQMLSPPAPHTASFNSGMAAAGNALLRPVQSSEREAVGMVMPAPGLFVTAGTPPTVYYQAPQQLQPQTPSSPTSDGPQGQPQMTAYGFPTVGASSTSTSFSELMQMQGSDNNNNSSGSGNFSYNGGGGGPTNTTAGGSAMGQITIGHPPHPTSRQQSVFTRLRAVPNARGAMTEQMVLSPSPQQATAVPTMQAQSTANMNPPMMVMMTNAEGQMALYPVVYNQPVYVLGQNGVVHQAQGAPQPQQSSPQQIVYTTALPPQNVMRAPQAVMTYPLTQDGTSYMPTSPPQGPVQNMQQYSGQQQQQPHQRH